MSVSILNPIPEAEIKVKKPLRRQARSFAVGLSREELIDSVSSILAGMIQQAGDDKPSSESKPSSPFHAKKVPSISIRDYLQRFGSLSKCSDSCFVILLILIDRISQKDPDFELDPLNIHRISLLGLVSAAKYQDDIFLKNKWYAEIGGVKTEDLNRLELEFVMNSLNFELYVEESAYKQYLKYCEEYFNKEIKGRSN